MSRAIAKHQFHSFPRLGNMLMIKLFKIHNIVPKSDDLSGREILSYFFMEITLGDATKLLDNIMANYSQWHTEKSSSKKVHVIEEINVLSGKMDELMKMFATKNTPLGPNDMHLSSLIEDNNVSMYVNFVGRNNFGNNAYRGNFNPRLFPCNSSNNYGNSYNNSYGNFNKMPSDFQNSVK